MHIALLLVLASITLEYNPHCIKYNAVQSLCVRCEKDFNLSKDKQTCVNDEVVRTRWKTFVFTLLGAIGFAIFYLLVIRCCKKCKDKHE